MRTALGQTPARPSVEADFGLAGGQLPLPRPSRRIADAPVEWGGAPAPSVRSLEVVAQLRETLILAEGPDGVFLVDQHRAHERVLYERLTARRGEEHLGQALLEPVVLELKPHQAGLVEHRLGDLDALGFAMERFGGRHFLLRSAPSLPGGELVAGHLREMLETAAAQDEGWRDRLMAQVACRSALRRGHPLDLSEMRALLGDLADARLTAVCPHGSPLILHFSARFLERQFNW